jgi:hypothetical protein
MNALLRRRFLSMIACATGLLPACATGLLSSTAEAQVVYYGAMRPVVAAPVMVAPVMAAPIMSAPAYVANYTPAGNYAAVTAFSPPVMGPVNAVAVTAAYAPAYAPAVAAPMAVTSYYAPATYAPTTAYYAPTTAYYAPTTAYSPVSEVVAAPVTAYYAPAAVAVPLYRRGLFGGLRPVRSPYFIPY